MKTRIHLLLIFFSLVFVFAQEPEKYHYRSVLFYNLENLFDTIDNPETWDDEFTPTGSYHWDNRRLSYKLDRIVEVIGDFSPFGHATGADIVGVCEVENALVLQRLTTHGKLGEIGYGYVHEDSPDLRGIDVAFIYKKSSFQPVHFRSHTLFMFNQKKVREYTRDQLAVHGFLDDEEIFFIVNHWPSRRGGEAKTQAYRMAAANLTRRIVDSIVQISSTARIIIMGDMNDDPLNKSIRYGLGTKSEYRDRLTVRLFNPMEELFRRGLGSLAYRDRWHLFDQLLVTPELLWPKPGNYRFWKAGIYMPDYLIQKNGPYKGYPHRTFSRGKYQGGYSDHFPVYLILIKPAG